MKAPCRIFESVADASFLITSFMVALASIYLGAFSRLSSPNSQQKYVGSLQMSTAVETDKMAALATAADEARGLAMDSIAAAHSGHMGLPLGAAEIGSVLYGSQVCTFPCAWSCFCSRCRRTTSHLLHVPLATTDDLQPEGPHLDQP